MQKWCQLVERLHAIYNPVARLAQRALLKLGVKPCRIIILRHRRPNRHAFVQLNLVPHFISVSEKPG